MGQTQAGEITGVISDSRGGVIRGATVILRNAVTGEDRTATSSETGAYRFTDLSPASYILRIERGGFKRAERWGVQVKAGQAVRLDVTLEVGSITESIVVTAIGPDADTSRSHNGFIRNIVKGARIGGGSAFQFFSQEMNFDNNMITGAPFSAEIASETIQTLANGTHIIQGFAGRIYRDSQGRTRIERAFHMGGTSGTLETIAIYDPVGGASYLLDPENRIADKTDIPVTAANAAASKIAAGEVTPGVAIKKIVPEYPAIAKAARASGEVLMQVNIGESGKVTEATVISGHMLLREAALQAARQWIFKPTLLSGRPIEIRGFLKFNFRLVDEEEETKYNFEKLSEQLVEGVKCNGERGVTTMPAGAIGNDGPIETVNETWYSPELKMMILSKRSDPRFGESTYRVSNIQRTEPDAALFQVPSDYTIKEGGKH
ncbi:MAG: TonB family protein [Blastocatellia bacterium]|nr:TonB family protein [Blastocatellia bacterium]